MNEQIIVLGGNSLKNRKWIQMLAREFEKDTRVHLFSYTHWEEKVGEIDFSEELERLLKTISEINGQYMIVAKSAGSLLALMALTKKLAAPTSLICVGFPLVYAAQRNIDVHALVNENNIPTLYIQAQDDPQGSAHDVEQVVGNRSKCITVSGDTHDYTNVAELKTLSLKYFSSIDL